MDDEHDDGPEDSEDDIPEGDEFELELAPTEALFDQPLRLRIPGVGSFDLLDRANPPREAEVDPTRQPVEYMVQYLARQVVDDQREEFTSSLIEAIESNKILVSIVPKAVKWISKKRRDAERKAIARKSGRPTRGR